MTVFAEVGYFEPWWIQILKAVAIFAIVFNLVPIALLAERKLLGRFQYRYGPNRVGPFGIFQPMADIGKLLFKQQFRPRTAIGWLFAIAPAISMLTAVATVAIIPFSNTVDIFGTEVGLYGVDPSIGILFAFAFGAIAFYGLMLGGWASGSKYSFLGAMRGAAQLISYEVAMGLSLLGVIMMAGSLSLTEIVEETGLHAMVSDTARIYSAHVPSAWRDGQRVDAHALRIVYDGWVPADCPEPRVVVLVRRGLDDGVRQRVRCGRLLGL